MKKFITDDTRKICKDSIFLITPQNEKFLNNLTSSIKTIHREDLSQYFNTNIKIIGITGTNGKTTISAAIYSMLLDMGYSVALLGTRGMFINDKKMKEKGLTTPSLLELYQNIDMAVECGCDYFIMEVSSHAIKQERIFGLEFHAKVLSNITSDHLDFHKTLDDYIQTKMDFLKSGNCPKIINFDDTHGSALRFFPNVFGYGVENKSHFFVSAYSLKDGIFARLNALRERFGNQKNDEKYEESDINSSLFGMFNLYNLMAAILTIKVISNRDLSEICEFCANFGGVSGRMEVVSKKPLIIVDFAHTTDGMIKVFESFKDKNISVVFGAGGDRDSTKREKMGHCASLYADKIYITSDNPRSESPEKIIQEIAKGANNHQSLQLIVDRKEAIKLAISELPDDWVLLILGKGDENVQIFKDYEIHFSDKECVLELLSL